MRHPSTGEVVTFPCGKCVECIQKYQNDWTFRLEQEYRDWKYAYFITMTYSNDRIPYVTLETPVESRVVYDDDGFTDYVEETEHPEYLDNIRNYFVKMPENKHLRRLRERLDEHSLYVHPDYIDVGIPVPSVSRVDVQNWLKRVREQYAYDHDGERLKFKYFICSEYGPSTFRPHYHAVIFVDFNVADFSKYFISDWQSNYGNVKWKGQPIKYFKKNGVGDAMAYVAKYCSKPSFAENPYVVNHVVPRCFRLISKKLGSNYMSDLIDKIEQWNDLSDGRRDISHREIREIKPWRDNDGHVHYDRYYTWKHYLTPKFCEWLSHCFTTLRNGFRYRIPRYYIDKVFPAIKVFVEYVDKKTNQIRERLVWRKDVTNPIWRTFKAYMVNECTKRLHDRLFEVASFLFGRTDLESLTAAEAWIRQDDLCRAQAKTQRLYDFYAKGLKYNL